MLISLFCWLLILLLVDAGSRPTTLLNWS
jgi:hypothetical protein